MLACLFFVHVHNWNIVAWTKVVWPELTHQETSQEISPRGKITVAKPEENAIQGERFSSGDMEGNDSQGKDYRGKTKKERNPRGKIPIRKHGRK